MKKKFVYISIFIIVILGLVNSFYRFFAFGPISLIGGDGLRVIHRSLSIVDGNPVTESSFTTKLGRVFGMEPPGYSIFFAELMLLTGLDALDTYTIFIFFSLLVFILLTFILGHTLAGKELGLLSSLFSSFSVIPITISPSIGEIELSASRMFPDLAGSNTDVLFISLSLFFIIKFIGDLDGRDSQILFCILLVLTAHSISHVSRFLSFAVTLILISLIWIFFLSLRNEKHNLIKIVSIFFVSTISLAVPYIFYYRPFLISNSDNDGVITEITKRIPGFLKIEYVQYIIFSLFLFAIILLFTTLRDQIIRRRFKNISSSYTSFSPYMMILIFSTIFLILSLNVAKYTSQHSVQDVFFIQIFIPETWFELVIISFALIFVFASFFSLAFYFNRDSKNLFINNFFVANLVFYISSILVLFHPSRMLLLIYFRPYALGGFFILLFRHNRSEVGKNIVASLVLVCLVLSQFTLMTYTAVVSGVSTNEMVIYENRLKSTPYTNSLEASQNMIEYLDNNLEGDYVLTTPKQQEIITLILSINYLEEEILNEWFVYQTYPILDFFERYNCSYFAITHKDIKDFEAGTHPYGDLNVNYFDSLPYLDKIYSNTLGEIIYRYNVSE